MEATNVEIGAGVHFLAWVRARLESGDTLTGIGRDLGVSHSAVWQWIQGVTVPSRQTLRYAERLMEARNPDRLMEDKTNI